LKLFSGIKKIKMQTDQTGSSLIIGENNKIGSRKSKLFELLEPIEPLERFISFSS